MRDVSLYLIIITLLLSSSRRTFWDGQRLCITHTISYIHHISLHSSTGPRVASRIVMTPFSMIEAKLALHVRLVNVKGTLDGLYEGFT